jgi:hypothetical protein
MKFEIDFKTLLTLAGVLAMLAGFFFTTKLRLDYIEQQIVELEEEQEQLNQRLRIKKGKKK